MTRKQLMDMIIVCGILLAGALYFENARADYGPYDFLHPAAIDGDTVRGEVAIWPGQYINVAVRVAGIDSPEIRSSLACERDAARKAREFTEKWLVANAPVRVSSITPDKYYGRVVAHVQNRSGALLGGALLAAGHARAYAGGQRQPWCTDATANEKLITQELALGGIQ